MIKITVKYDLKVTKNDVSKIGSKSGIYVFFDQEGNPLYVGQASDLKSRIYAHFNGFTNTSMHSYLFHKCKIFYEENQLHKDLYEMYLINTLKAPINLAKSYKTKENLNITKEMTKRKVNKNLCSFVKKDGNPCRHYAHTNGYCFFHGGNGISKSSIIKKALQQSSVLFENQER